MGVRCFNLPNSETVLRAPGAGAMRLIPRGSRYAFFKGFGPKYHLEYGFWNQKAQILDTWNVWDCEQTISSGILGLGLLQKYLLPGRSDCNGGVLL